MPHPFHPHDASFNRDNALYLAHASDVAYIRSPRVAAKERLGLESSAFLNRVTRTRGFLGVCETHAVLSFRGSDPLNIQTWVTDAVVKLVESSEYDGRVHHGFSSALRRTWKKIEAILEEVRGKPLFLTGHSMGGALAVLTACRLAKMGRPPVAIYTFGSPRVGDVHFCANYSIPTYRVVNRLDLVPEMPLAAVRRRAIVKVAEIKRRTKRVHRYGHVKTLVYIDMDGEITTDAEIAPWHSHAVYRAIATRGKSFLEGVTDHLISNYIRGLEGKITRKVTGNRRRKNAE